MKISNIDFFAKFPSGMFYIFIEHSRWKLCIFLWGGGRVLLRSILPNSGQKHRQKLSLHININQFFTKFPPSMFYEEREISIISLESFHLVYSVKRRERGSRDFLIIVSTVSRNKAVFSIIGQHNSRTVSRNAFHNRAQISRSIISVSRNRDHNRAFSRTLQSSVLVKSLNNRLTHVIRSNI